MEKYQKLLRAIEVASGLSMSSRHDFEKLSSLISERLHASLSISTIRRCWKKGNTGEHHSQHTKDMYARLVGYPHFVKNTHLFNVAMFQQKRCVHLLWRLGNVC